MIRRAPGGLPPDRSVARSTTSKAAGSSADASAASTDGNRKADEWLVMFVAGMWFQDLWTYDFRRTEMCIIPYATQMGEISFCAYNTGVGWRQIVENMHKNATVAEWYPRARQARRSMPIRASPCRCPPTRSRSRSRSRATAGSSSGPRPKTEAPEPALTH